MDDPSHIHKLPNDILAKVFVYFATESSGWYCQWLPMISTERLCDIMLVCRHWREVASSAADLWRQMNIGQRYFTWSDGCYHIYVERVERAARYFDLILPRTADAPLEVRAVDAEVSAYILPKILESQAHRLRRVSVRVPQGSSQLLELTRLLANTSLPLLEELRIDPDRYDDPVATPIEDRVHLPTPALTLELFPALHTLCQEAVVIYETSVPLLSRLTILYLEYCSFDFGSAEPLNRFIEVLGGCKNLSELRVWQVLNSHDLPPKDSAPKVAKLEKLSTLDLRDAPEYTSWFLSSISIDNDVDISVTGTLDEIGPFDNIPDRFASLCPASMASRLQAVTDGYICPSNTHDNEDMALGSSKTHLSIQGPGLWASYVRPELEVSLRAFSRVFAGAPITKLDIRAGKFGDVSRGGRDSEIWVDLFTQFPDIKKLYLTSCGSLTGIFSALGRPPRQQADCDSQAGMPVCPRLESITAEGMMWETTGMVESLAAVLRRRSALGLPKWKVLDFIDSFENVGGPLREVAALYKDDVLGNVERLSFKGRSD